MNKVIFVAFDTEKQAYEGDRALHEMHNDGAITLYNDAVVVKEKDGKVALREQPDVAPVGTIGGLLTGGLIGLLGGPVGAAVGLGAGTLVGAAFDLTKAGIDKDFVTDAAAKLEVDKAAVVAEIDEEWEVPVDTRMEAAGGKVLRRTRTQIDDAYLERTIETTQKQLSNLEAEKLASVKASQEAKANKEADRLQAKIDTAKRDLQKKEDELSAKIKSVEKEGKDRIAVLEAQKVTASQESKALLDRRLADVRKDYDGRAKRLRELQQSAHATA